MLMFAVCLHGSIPFNPSPTPWTVRFSQFTPTTYVHTPHPPTYPSISSTPYPVSDPVLSYHHPKYIRPGRLHHIYTSYLFLFMNRIGRSDFGLAGWSHTQSLNTSYLRASICDCLTFTLTCLHALAPFYVLRMHGIVATSRISPPTSSLQPNRLRVRAAG